MTYQIVNFRGSPACIRKTDGDLITLIPMNEANTDYQQYLAWLADGNQPLPADE